MRSPASRLPALLFLALLACAPRWLGAAEDALGSDSADAPSHLDADGISLRLAKQTQFVRLGAPIQVGIGIAAARERTGHLVITLCDGDQPAIAWRSPEWTLSAAARTVDVLLPAPPQLGVSHDALNARMEWEDGSGRTLLGTVQVALPGQNVRPLTFGWCPGVNGDRRAAIELASLADILGSTTVKSWRADARVVNITIAVERMPTQALALCGYDVLALSADALQRLGEHQRAALARWLLGGGALAIMADGERLAPVVAGFVRGIIHTGVDDDGRLPSEGPALLARIGLGRCAVVPVALARAEGQRQDRAACLFLWRVREDSVGTALASGGALDPRALVKLEEARGGYYGRGINVYNNAQGGQDASELDNFSFAQEGASQRPYTLTALLMPSGIGVVPFSLVAVIIVIYALAIGPGDWLLLGRFKAHRYTWILFPALSIACAFVLMSVANHYLGTNEHRTRLAVLDAGEHGQWLRQDVYEELFTANAGPVRSTLQDALWTPYTAADGGFVQRRGGAVGAQEEPPLVDGTLGGHCETVQQVGQWSPTLRRSLSFTPSLAPPITLDRELSGGELAAYVQELHKRWPTLYAVRLHGQDMDVLAGSLDSLRPSEEDGRQMRQDDFLREFSVLPRSGFFTLVGMVSPCGGNLTEDTAVYDSTDSEHCLLAIALRDGDTVWMLRRIYHS